MEPRSNSIVDSLGLIALAVVLALVFWKLTTPAGQPPQVEVGTPLPPLAAAGWLNVPPRAAFEPREGNVLVVDCWATWCPPCIQEIPRLAKVVQQYRPLGVDFVGLTSETDAKSLGEFIKATPKFDWPVGYGAIQFMDELRIDQLPTVIVLDADGRVAWSGGGSEGLEDALDRALAKGKAEGGRRKADAGQ